MSDKTDAERRERLRNILRGLAVGGVAIAARALAEGSSLRDFERHTQDAIDRAAARANEKAARAHAKAVKLQERRARIGDGAHDPGAVVILPKADEHIVEPKYGYGLGRDLLGGMHLIGSTYGYRDKAGTWALRADDRTGARIALLHGTFSDGWREGVGAATAVTVTHSHRDSFFPYRDSLYADALPLDRFAMMLERGLQPKKGPANPVIVIDNREAHRAEHARLARAERPATGAGLEAMDGYRWTMPPGSWPARWPRAVLTC
jgi:hypothetical protein